MTDADHDAGALWHHFTLVMSFQAALICCPSNPRPHRQAILTSKGGAVRAFKNVARGLGDQRMYDLADHIGLLMDRVGGDDLDAETYTATGVKMAALSEVLTTTATKYSQSSDARCRAPCGLGLPDCTQ